MIPLVLIRADAGVTLGLGHVTRCRTLADRLAANGWRIGWAVSAETLEVVPWLTGHAELLVLSADDGPSDEAAAIATRWPSGADLLIVDHYGRDSSFETACRPWAHRILVIDDLADRLHDCDLLLDQNAGRSGAAYDGLVRPATEILAGSAFALLRPEFGIAGHRREPAAEMHRILVMMGGTDAINATAAVLTALERSETTAVVDVMLGGTAPHLADIREQLDHSRLPAVLHTDVRDVAALMARVDLAIGAGGVGALERAAAGVPQIVLIAAENQRPGTLALGATGAALVVERLSGIASAIAALAGDRTRRQTMAECARRLVDGRGAWRVALALAGSAGDGVTLRLAETDDADWMFRLQTAPATRRFSRNPMPPGRIEHQAWFDGTLTDPARVLCVITLAGTAVGVLRLDPLPDASGYEVSVAIEAARHGLGIGAAALALTDRLVPGRTLDAEIDPRNLASEALFRSAGYHIAAPRRWRRASATAASAPAPSEVLEVAS